MNNAQTIALSEAVFHALGVSRVGLIGGDDGLSARLSALGMVCVVGERPDAWVIQAPLTHIEAGDLIPSRDDGRPAFLVCVKDDAPAEMPLRSRVEAAMLRHGYIKHPAMMQLFPYEELDANPDECWLIFDYRPLAPGGAEDAARLAHERDLHADMLREAGVRSDAHLVRYDVALGLVRPGDIVLDAACGLGYGSYMFDSLSPAAHVIGLDISEWAVDFARRNYGGESVEFRCGSLPSCLDEMPPASVDFIVSLETLEHVEDPGALLAAFWRVLKPGGRIFVSVPNDWADETGDDPNPHHLHVYDWARLRAELSEAFLIETAWSLTASGCKTGEDRKWRPQPRKLETVALEAAATTEGEWWLACASKSPLATAEAPYCETIHVNFEGATHLVDFAAYYDRPWLVRSMVETPWRIRDRAVLRDIAAEVVAQGRPGSADLGAALAVLGWRVLEDEGASARKAQSWLDLVDSYVASGSAAANPHVRRWSVSLNYLRGRFFEARGDAARARAAYRSVVSADVRTITPTLGTKQADAALRAGLLAVLEGDVVAALLSWREGLDALFLCLHADPVEFIGNRDRPFLFAMNDFVEIADGAVQLCSAIDVVSRTSPDRTETARRLGQVTQKSLRSAVSRLDAQGRRQAADLRRHLAALQDTAWLATDRGAEVQRLQAALTQTQWLVAERDANVARLEAALTETQTLAIARAAEGDDLRQALAFAQSLVAERDVLIALLAPALKEAQSLAVARAAHGETLQQALTFSQDLLADRDARLSELETALGQLRTGLAEKEVHLAEVNADARTARAEAETWRRRCAEMAGTWIWRFGASLRLTPVRFRSGRDT